jgi:hypothetical protein
MSGQRTIAGQYISLLADNPLKGPTPTQTILTTNFDQSSSLPCPGVSFLTSQTVQSCPLGSTSVNWNVTSTSGSTQVLSANGLTMAGVNSFATTAVTSTPSILKIFSGGLFHINASVTYNGSANATAGDLQLILAFGTYAKDYISTVHSYTTAESNPTISVSGFLPIPLGATDTLSVTIINTMTGPTFTLAGATLFVTQIF